MKMRKGLKRKNNPNISIQSISVQQKAFLQGQQSHVQFVRILRIAMLVVFLIIWQVASGSGLINSFIFSSPHRLIVCAAGLLADGTLLHHIFVTLYETLLSFVFVTFLSLLLAMLLWQSRKLSEICEPYLVVLNSLPKSALAPLFIVWLGNGLPTIIVTGISIAIFGAILNLYTGFCDVDPEKQKLILTLGGTQRDALRYVILPSNFPLLLSIMKSNIGLCLVGVIIGEFIASRSGLGYLIIYGSQIFKLDWVILAIVILCIIAMGLYKIISLIEKWYSKKW